MILWHESQVTQAISDIRKTFAKDGRVDVTIKQAKRSLPQNAIAAVWYDQIAKDLGEDDAAMVKQFCKYHFGLPILYAEDEEFASFCRKALGHLDYEDRIDAMSFVPVTRLFNKDQMSRYLEKVQAHYRDKRGVWLEFPQEMRGVAG